MIYTNNEMSREDFQKAVEFNGLEVFTQDQIKNYGLYVGALISKSEKGDLSPDEQNALNTGKAELKNLKQVRVVEQVDGRIVKSLFFVQEPQVKYQDTIEKSENGESIQKGVFLDTPLNKELGRVGVEFTKGCVKKDIRKTEEAGVYKALVDRGVTDVYSELKKAYPEMGEDKYNEIKKAMDEEGSESEEKEEPEEEEKEETEGDEIEKSLDTALGKINDNFNKGLITEEIASKAVQQLDDLIVKARPTKYIKREGSPGKYKYYYTMEQYKKDHPVSTTEESKKPANKKEDKGGEGSKVDSFIDGLNKEEAKELVSKIKYEDSPSGGKVATWKWQGFDYFVSAEGKPTRDKSKAAEMTVKEAAEFDKKLLSAKTGGEKPSKGEQLVSEIKDSIKKEGSASISVENYEKNEELIKKYFSVDSFTSKGGGVYELKLKEGNNKQSKPDSEKSPKSSTPPKLDKRKYVIEDSSMGLKGEYRISENRVNEDGDWVVDIYKEKDGKLDHVGEFNKDYTDKNAKEVKESGLEYNERIGRELKSKLPNNKSLKNPKKGDLFTWEGNLSTVTKVNNDGSFNAVWHGGNGDRTIKFDKDGEEIETNSRLKPHTKISSFGFYFQDTIDEMKKQIDIYSSNNKESKPDSEKGTYGSLSDVDLSDEYHSEKVNNEDTGNESNAYKKVVAELKSRGIIKKDSDFNSANYKGMGAGEAYDTYFVEKYDLNKIDDETFSILWEAEFSEEILDSGIKELRKWNEELKSSPKK